VEDDGRGASATPSANGYGLLGMNERASAAGGTFVAGPRPGGGWRVAASFPVPAVTAPRLVS
jgi:signal transduction histidine kinase